VQAFDDLEAKQASKDSLASSLLQITFCVHSVKSGTPKLERKGTYETDVPASI
jgi:hypothetical protein